MLGPAGFLPPGRRLVTVDEFHANFVAAFPGSKTREPLFDAWQMHRSDIANIVDVRRQWIGGSFVSSKVDPGDVDMLTMYDGPHFEALSPGMQSLADKLMSGPKAKLLYGIDSYSLAVYPDSHPMHGDYLYYRGYWDEWFSRIKSHDDIERGYLELKP